MTLISIMLIPQPAPRVPLTLLSGRPLRASGGSPGTHTSHWTSAPPADVPPPILLAIRRQQSLKLDV